ncbi:hypothetical protein ATN84_01790 [Paramesorhizobium deserti]|uniref:Helix-turn-helix domain-containing protein n=1 Tax=Paramesorhizobium deserti TaxID=1494590 RepID=A0A135HZD8_9HYPH|nr:hypothetical protein [Paramesorhizobium deserti]KXF78549.1 hypothetical protein ATN84_01790 [Paramesorhizobium deserti]
MNDNKPLALDILQGAAAIAAYTGFKPRSVYHLAATGAIPTFKVGDIICARKSTLIDWISMQEGRAA